MLKSETEELEVPSEPLTEASVAQYGLLAPIEGRAMVDAQMRAASRYYNDLIALERCRRAVYRDLRRQHVPELDQHEQTVRELGDKLEELRTAIKATRQEARGRVKTPELDQAAARVREELKMAREELKASRQRAATNKELAQAALALEERTKIWHKALRATTETYWGTYIFEEQSLQQARKALIDPTFRRAQGRERVSRTGQGPAEGRIGVQIQGGMTTEELMAGEDSRLRITPAPPELAGRRGTSARAMRRGARYLLHIRVGSDGRAPIWAVFPLILHRPLPEGAVIKVATVSLRLEAFRERWTVALTYIREAVPMPQHAGVLALDLGWRKRPDASLRVAYGVDDSGHSGEYVMPKAVRDRMKRTRDLREVQDRLFNRAVRWLALWLKHAPDSTPAWLRDESATLGSWRSHQRLRRLVLRWRNERFAEDEVIFGALMRWVHKSRHLYEYECGERSGALGLRKETYRCIAASIAKHYGIVVLERFNLAEAKRLVMPEQGDNAPRAQRAQLHTAAPGELRQCIVQAVQREGGLIVELDAAHTTSICHACGASCVWDQGEQLWHTCEHCGALWDQDHNAAKNLLRMFCDQRSADQSPEGARKAPKRAARFAKRHKAKVDT